MFGVRKEELREDGGQHVMRSPLHRVVLRRIDKDGILSTGEMISGYKT